MLGGYVRAVGRLVGAVVVSASIVAVTGASIIYESVSYAGNYAGELFNKGRLALIERKYKDEAYKTLISSAKRNGLLTEGKTLTNFEDCVVESAAKDYAASLKKLRTGTHIQSNSLLGGEVATFQTLIDLPAEAKDHFLIKARDNRGSFTHCESKLDLAIDQIESALRLRNMAGSMVVKFSAAASLNEVAFEISDYSYGRDSYLQQLASPLARKGVDTVDVLGLAFRLETIDRNMRGPFHQAGKFYYSTQVRDLQGSYEYNALNATQKSAVTEILNLSAVLPKHSSQIEQETRQAEQLRLAELSEERRRWEDAEIAKATAQEWESHPKNSPEYLAMMKILMQPPSLDHLTILSGPVAAKRDYEEELRKSEKRIRESQVSDYNSVKSEVEARLRKEWAQGKSLQAAPSLQ